MAESDETLPQTPDEWETLLDEQISPLQFTRHLTLAELAELYESTDV